MSGLSLFSAFGIELEYMIVDTKRLTVRPIADRILVDRDGDPVADLEFGTIAWSNELVNHVIELKTNGPAPSLFGLADQFAQNITVANKRLAKFGARLMPTAMHPWMDPQREKQLWLGENNDIYETFDRIFDCTGHGWANVQSTHLNLPFDGDEEFGRLHAAIRLVLPLLPAIAASSPIYDGQLAPFRDSRLHHYIHHCDAIPSIVGAVVPEPVYTAADYEREILQPMYLDLVSHDADGILKEEFLNARGAIARFSRGSIEIRLLDVQECPAADLAIAGLVISLMKSLVAEQTSSFEEQKVFATEQLQEVLMGTIEQSADYRVTDANYLRLLGVQSSGDGMLAGEVWQAIFERVADSETTLMDESIRETCRQLLVAGPLCNRIIKACGGDYSPPHLRHVYSELCDSLNSNQLYLP